MATSLSNLLPVFVLLLFVLAAAGVGYAVYSVAASVADTTSKKMERKHVVLTKEGMRVGVREVAREGYVDRTQRYGYVFILFSPFLPAWLGCFILSGG